ncbi:hypothetical protein CCACVL1_01544, partial [Corchorus capsularis]
GYMTATTRVNAASVINLTALIFIGLSETLKLSETLHTPKDHIDIYSKAIHSLESYLEITKLSSIKTIS